MAVIVFKCPHCNNKIEYERDYDGVSFLMCPYCNKEIDLKVALSFTKQLKEIFVTFGLEILKSPIYFFNVISDIILGNQEIVNCFYILSRTNLFPDVFRILDEDSDNKLDEANALARRYYHNFYIEEKMILRVILLVFDAYNESLTDINQNVVCFFSIYEDDEEKVEIDIKRVSYEMGFTFLVRKDYRSAYLWFLIAFKEGNPEACYYLGMFFANGKAVEKSYETAAKYFLAGAKRGNPLSMFQIAIAYLNGAGVEKNPKLALKYFEKAATKGVVKAMFYAGLCHERGLGTPADLNKALFWFEMGSEQNDGDCLYHAGALLVSSKSTVKRDPEKGIKYLTRASDMEHAAAQYFLAFCYLKGIGVEKDRNKAIELMKRSADNGYKEAIEIVKKL